jgi:cobalamin biosynthetic protein CobC
MSVIAESLRGAVADHGGSLERARNLFPGAPEPWVDLSTGINPHSYPHPPISATALSRLPETADVLRLQRAAAAAYGAPATALVAAPGTQILLPQVMSLLPPGRAAVLSPTYAEHARVAALAGHRVSKVASVEELAEADLAVVVNPNNPDGRVLRRADLLDLARALGRRGGLLVVDEAFMEVGPTEESVAGDVEDLPIVELRSFGKFFGLAGLRLGFAIAAKEAAERLGARLGPWAVSGPALEVGLAALADRPWQEAMRGRLEKESQRLDDLIQAHGLNVSGGTSLFRFVRDPRAPKIFAALGRSGILVRSFDAMPDALRFGLPGDEEAWTRLEVALDLWSRA